MWVTLKNNLWALLIVCGCYSCSFQLDIWLHQCFLLSPWAFLLLRDERRRLKSTLITWTKSHYFLIKMRIVYSFVSPIVKPRNQWELISHFAFKLAFQLVIFLLVEEWWLRMLITKIPVEKSMIFHYLLEGFKWPPWHHSMRCTWLRRFTGHLLLHEGRRHIKCKEIRDLWTVYWNFERKNYQT